ncbi:MAG: DUF4097 domain-containing protein [Firmicutes bacterium]|nr:DUF4097 domain-containing protein [Bacillota bacterium]
MKENIFEAKKSFKAIYVDDKDTKVIVDSTSENNVIVKYTDRKREYYAVEESDVLKIKKIFSLKWYHYFLRFNFRAKIEIYLPKNYAGGMEIKTSNGSVSINSVTAESIDVITSNGKIVVENLAVENEFKFRSSNGKFCAENVKGKSFEIQTSNGKISVVNAEFQDSFKCRTSNGKIIADGVRSNEIELKSSNGRVFIDRASIGTSMKVKTSNGSIKGNILGKREDFTIESKTSNGKNNLPENISHSLQKGDKKLNIETSNGCIDIIFI